MTGVARTDLFTAAKAKYGAVVAGVLGFIVPGVTYLMTVDGDGISAGEWRRAVFIAIAATVVQAGGVGAVVYQTRNEPKTMPPAEPDPYDDGGLWPGAGESPGD